MLVEKLKVGFAGKVVEVQAGLLLCKTGIQCKLVPYHIVNGAVLAFAKLIQAV